MPSDVVKPTSPEAQAVERILNRPEVFVALGSVGGTWRLADEIATAVREALAATVDQLRAEIDPLLACVDNARAVIADLKRYQLGDEEQDHLDEILRALKGVSQ